MRTVEDISDFASPIPKQSKKNNIKIFTDIFPMLTVVLFHNVKQQILQESTCV